MKATRSQRTQANCLQRRTMRLHPRLQLLAWPLHTSRSLQEPWTPCRSCSVAKSPSLARVVPPILMAPGEPSTTSAVTVSDPATKGTRVGSESAVSSEGDGGVRRDQYETRGRGADHVAADGCHWIVRVEGVTAQDHSIGQTGRARCCYGEVRGYECRMCCGHSLYDGWQREVWSTMLPRCGWC